MCVFGAHVSSLTMSVVPAELSELLGMAFAPHASFARSRDSVTMPWPSVNVIGCARAALRPVDISLEMLDLRCWILPREILVFIRNGKC